MNIFIDNKSGTAIYDQIFTQIRDQIISGALAEDSALPSIRNLAKDLRISVITTKRAYDELEKEGFIYSVAGKGSFVAESGGQKDARKQELFAQLRSLSAELKLLGVSDQELCDLVRGGNEN